MISTTRPFFPLKTRVSSTAEENPLVLGFPVEYRLVRETRIVHGTSLFVLFSEESA